MSYYYYHYYYCCLIFFVKTIWDENFMPKVSFFMWVLWWISASSPRGCRRGSRCPRDWFVTCLHDDKTDDAIWCYMMLWCYEEMWRDTHINLPVGLFSCAFFAEFGTFFRGLCPQLQYRKLDIAINWSKHGSSCTGSLL